MFVAEIGDIYFTVYFPPFSDAEFATPSTNVFLKSLYFPSFSYAGMACVEVKGHSKSVGYEPGMKIREESFQNTWNAVVIEGDWWPVQCNWGAR